MSPEDEKYYDTLGAAAGDAHEAFRFACESLPMFKNASEQYTFSQSALMISWMVCYQLSIGNQKIIDRLNDVIESVDCAGATTPDFWMTSDLAAIDKAKEIGLKIQYEWSTADLRYKLHQAIYGGDNG